MPDLINLQIRDQKVNLLNQTGVRMFASGKIQEAIFCFNNALSINPKSAQTLNNLGVANWKHGDKETAFHMFYKAMIFNPTDRQIVIHCGTAAKACGKIKDFSFLYLKCAQTSYDNDVMEEYIDIVNGGNGKYPIAHTSPPNRKQVVFIANKPISREAKLAYGLKKKGFDVVLIHGEEPNFDASRYCTQIHRYHTPAQCLELAKTYNPIAFHVFAMWAYEVAALLIRNTMGKIVLDDYDVMAGMVKQDFAMRNYPGNMALERYCLENADGLCCRSLGTQFAKRHMGYNFGGKSLFLLDGCWSDGPHGHHRHPKIRDGKVHIVYCGNISPEITGSYNYHYDVASLLSKEHIHYHIYPYYAQHTPIIKKNLHGFVLTRGGNPDYVHVHQPVPSDRLIQEISRYHYGLHLMWPNPRSHQDDFPYELRDLDYGSTNKIFDYMDAGLRIFVHKGKLQKFLVERYANGIAISDLSQLLVKTIPDPPPVPEAFQNGSNIDRLIRFYEGL